MEPMKRDESLREMINLYNHVNEFTEIINEELSVLNKYVFGMLTKKMNEKYNTACESQKIED